MKLFFKLLLLLVLVFLLQTAWFYLSGGQGRCYPETVQQAYNVLAKRPDVLFCGDSVLYSCSELDRRQNTIPQLLQELLGDRMKVESFYHAAYDSGVFSSLVQAMLRRGEMPPVIIIPLNMRSFSENWKNQPEWWWLKEKFILRYDSFWSRPFFFPIGVFKGFYRDPVIEKYHPLDRFLGKKQGNLLGWNYRLDKKNPNFQALSELLNFLSEQRTRVFFYVTPVNYQYGIEVEGVKFLENVRNNISLVRKALQAAGCNLLDLSETIPAANFTGFEHLDEKGRSFVARRIYFLLTGGVTDTQLEITSNFTADAQSESATPDRICR